MSPDPGLLNDPRLIKAIDVWPHGDESAFFSTTLREQDRAEKIEPYQEIDNLGGLVWIRVWKNGEVVFRVLASSCAITYRATTQDTEVESE